MTKSAARKNPITFIVFFLFIIILPLATVFFSKSGLDVYKEINKEMRFHKDSIRVDVEKLTTYNIDTLKNIDLVQKAVIVLFWTKEGDMKRTIDTLKKIKNKFKRKDQKSILFLVHTDDFLEDSTWNNNFYAQKWDLDTIQWKFVKGFGNEKKYRLNQKPNCTTVALLDGRVSRKDKSDNYLKGPILCDNYDITKQEDVKKMLRNLVIILPKEERSKFEYKADEKLF